jgi:hypothetical protein
MVLGSFATVFLQSATFFSFDGWISDAPQNEKWTEPADHHDTRGQFNPAVHSTKGINSVSLAGFQWPIFSQHVIEATRELPEWPFNLDTNSGKPLGLGTWDGKLNSGRI